MDFCVKRDGLRPRSALSLQEARQANRLAATATKAENPKNIC